MKKQYLHNLLRFDEKIFYLDRFEIQLNTFSQALQIIDNEYNSILRQNKVKIQLSTLRLTMFTIDELSSPEEL